MFPNETYEIRGIKVTPKVCDQPTSDHETLLGAEQRALDSRLIMPKADFWVGIEGGIEDYRDEMQAFAWVVILSKELKGKGRTGAFYLPPSVADLIRKGKELGEADDIVFGRSNSKQENGAIGLLTGNIIDRAQLYEHAVILALVPFKNKALFLKSPGDC